MTDNEPALKPCPFCGGKPHRFCDVNDYGTDYYIECFDCPGGVQTSNEETAIRAWNTRPEPASAWQPIETLDLSSQRIVLVRKGRGYPMTAWTHKMNADYWTHWCEVSK